MTRGFIRTVLGVVALLLPAITAAEIRHNPGPLTLVPYEKYARVVSELDSPIQPTYIKTKDGLYVAAAIRKPKGAGPFPALIHFHGAPAGQGMELTVKRARGDVNTAGPPALQRLLEQGYVLVVADYRAGETNSTETFSTSPKPSAIDDGVSIIEHVRSLPFVDSSRIHLWGGSLGANLVLHLISRMPEIKSAVLGSPAPLGFLGIEFQRGPSAPEPRSAAELLAQMTRPDSEVASRNIAPIKTPILILIGTADPVLETVTALHNALDGAKKSVRMEVYEGGDHYFLADGARFNTGGLDALEKSLQFITAR